MILHVDAENQTQITLEEHSTLNSDLSLALANKHLIVLFSKIYVYDCSVFMNIRRRNQIPLQMVVSYHVVLEMNSGPPLEEQPELF